MKNTVKRRGISLLGEEKKLERERANEKIRV